MTDEDLLMEPGSPVLGSGTGIAVGVKRAFYPEVLGPVGDFF